MFTSRKPQTVIPHDNYYRRLWDSLHDARDEIEHSVQKVRCYLKSIEYYPEGPDRQKEQHELDAARQALLNAVAHYDDIYNQIWKYYRDHDGLRGTQEVNCLPSNLRTSHEFIRMLVSKGA